MNSGTITLRLTQPNGKASQLDVLAQIEAVGQAQTSPRAVIVSADAARGLDVDVAPGHYQVRLFLPGGGVLQDDCIVDAGDKIPVTFAEPVERSQIFNLQEVIGRTLLSDTLDLMIDARETRPAKASRKPAKPVATSGKGRARSSKSAGVRAARRGLSVGGAVAVRPGRTTAPSGMSPVLRLLDEPADGLLVSWELLGDRVAVAELAGNARRHKPVRSRDGAAIWRLHSDPRTLLSRQYALVDTGTGLELAAVPANWRDARSGHSSAIDLAVDTTVGGKAATSVAVHDPALDALLSYLAPGQLRPLGAVMGLLDAEGLIERTIAEKAENPLAACAAAYAGLALFDPSLQERWDSWLPNLMNRFPSIPDGAIVHARRIMLRPHCNDPTDALLNALRTAVKAGLPYYGVGLQLLRDMLQMLSPDHTEARKLLERVTPAAARLDPRQLFTVLRYPRDPS